MAEIKQHFIAWLGILTAGISFITAEAGIRKHEFMISGLLILLGTAIIIMAWLYNRKHGK